MTTSFIVTDLNQNRSETVTGGTEALALKGVYELLCDWNHDERDCAAAIEAGWIKASNSVDYRQLSLEHDAVAFWSECVNLMLSDAQDICEGEAGWAPWSEEAA